MMSAERWLPFGLVALLVVLGALQYRWAGALGEAEKERLEAGLRSSLRRFNAEVEDEIARIFRFFRFESEDDLADTYRAWAANEGSPNLIQAVYVRRDDETFEIAPDGTPPSRVATDFSFDPREFPISRSPLAAWMPLGDPRESRHRREPPSFVVVALDRKYLSERVLPEAASRHVSEYDVVVLEESETLWASDGADVEGTLGHPDAVSGLLDVGPFSRGFRGGREPHPRRPRGEARVDRERADPGPGRGPHLRLPPPRSGQDAGRDGRPQGAFRVVVRHRAGSLQAAVDQARRRNLGLAFGVLAVLAASIVLLSVLSRRARGLSERQMEFVAGVSHELRTPVAVIRSAAQNLADGSVTDPVKVERYGKMLEREASRLEHLVEEVLELAGIQSNKRQYARERLVARELLEEVARQAASELEPRLDGRDLVTSVSDEGLTVEGDREALERALSNLVRNAVKHARDGAVELALFRRDDHVVFSVSDRGPGIAEEDSAHLFEAFYRGRRALERQIPGSGLGLSLVSHIVREHGGEVTVAAREGGGATFEIRLPESRSSA